uniref:Retroviral polymerase SH3-like domain-containing protein n=1 Tax=Chenopodium quinoa TaxID=63459 RepID=A0A803LY61_CHEQI
METDNESIVSKPVTMEDLLQLLSQLNTNKSTIDTSNQPIQISEKLNHKNYTKWSKLMQLGIGGRGRLNHITTPPPPPEDPEYTKWAQRDSIVISWVIENIEPELQNQFLDYPTARELWKRIETMYGSNKDGLQIFDLTVKANKIQQGTDPIEVYYSKLTAIWKEIDRRLPNPMTFPEDKTIFNRLNQQNRLYQFLAGLDETLDKDRRDLLHRDPLPTTEEAYASIRRELSRRGIMKTTTNPSSSDSPGIGSGFAAKGRTEKPAFRREDDWASLKCTHCVGTRHTKDGCFKIIGYPEWWTERKKKGPENQGMGTAKKPSTSIVAYSAGDGEGGEAMAAASTTKSGLHLERESDEGKTLTFCVPTHENGDSQTGKIIGRGTEENGLFYVDQMSHQGSAALVRGSVEHQLWTWHRRLGHPSLGNKLAPRAVRCVFVGYGINQKGYRCFDPVTNRLYTTMDCDFVETEYYYHHLRSQGEGLVEDLSWLTYPELVDPDPKEQVGKATEITDNILQSILQGALPDDSNTLTENPIRDENEVCTPDSCEPANIPFEGKSGMSSESTREEESQEQQIEENSKKYVLPPRSTRGVPPKRYDPDFEAQRSKYPVSRPSEGNLSRATKAFNAAIYSESIPTTTEEALKSKHWKKAMEEEINALVRNKTWEKYADWGADRDSRKSTSGYFTLVGGNLVSWKSKRQKVVAMSSAEAKVRGIAKGITEVLWLRKLLIKLGYRPKKSCKLYCDNMAAIRISENPVQHDRTKHVEIDRHFIKDHLESKVISLPFVRSEDQLADILTKAVTTQAFEGALCKLGVGDPTTQLEGEC